MCDFLFEEFVNKMIEDIDKLLLDLGFFEEIVVEFFQEFEKYNDVKFLLGDLQVFYFNIFIMYIIGSEYLFEYLKFILFQVIVCKNVFLNLNIFQLEIIVQFWVEFVRILEVNVYLLYVYFFLLKNLEFI